MHRIVTHIVLAALVNAATPAVLLADTASPAPAEATTPPADPSVKKRSNLVGFAKRVAQQIGPQVLPVGGSLKAVAGQVALSAVQQADSASAPAAPAHPSPLPIAAPIWPRR